MNTVNDKQVRSNDELGVLALPEPGFSCGDLTSGEVAYTAEQMRAYGDACAKAMRKVCAKICDEAEDITTSSREATLFRKLGEAIRASSLPPNYQ